MIYLVEWYDEDDYGPMNCISAIVQANDHAEAKQIAIEHILNAGTGINTLEQKEECKVVDVSDQECIAIKYSSF